MRIGFYLRYPSEKPFCLHDFCSNPGIGGSEFVFLYLLHELSLRENGFNYYGFSETTISLPKGSNVSWLGGDLNQLSDMDAVVALASTFEELISHGIEPKKIIVWSHHPHDKRLVKARGLRVVSIGDYQYRSNRLIVGPHFRIPNLTPKFTHLETIKPRRLNEQFVFLGGIYPAKGLHLIIEMWPKIKSHLPNAILNVIGGDIYGDLASTQANLNYVRQIKGLLNNGKHELKNSIIFHGVVSAKTKAKIISGSSVAVLNPSGKSEASPASLIECHSFAIPVISGGDFGSHDTMSLTPELDLLKVDIGAIITRLQDPDEYKRAAIVSLENAKNHFNLNEGVLVNWEKLFHGSLKKSDTDFTNHPLRVKILVRHLLYNSLFRKIRNYIRAIKN